MIFSISDSIFLASDDNSIDLLNKIWLKSIDRHFLYIDTAENYEKISKSEWYKSLRSSSRTQLEIFYNESVNKKRRDIKLIISGNNEDFSLIEAEEILTKPLSIILENIENDAYFLEAILKNFISSASKLIKFHYKNGWIKNENGGGSTIANVIQSHKTRFEKDKASFPKENYNYLRLFVMIDSDKEYPMADEFIQDKKSLVEILKNNNIVYHVTNKREIENYIPDEVVAEIQNNDMFIKAYNRLSPIQKDYFDLEKGFPNIKFENLNVEIQKLYQNISDNDKKVFRTEKIVLMKDGKKMSFKSEFPKYFEHEKVTLATLSKRASSNELEQILNKISQLL